MKQTFVYYLPCAPPTVNHYHGHNGGRVFLTKKARDFHALVKETLNGEKMPPNWKYCAVWIIITPPRRRCDVDNRVKILLDAFTRAGFWYDDEAVASLRVEFRAPIKGNKDGAATVMIEHEPEKYKEL